MLPAHGVGLFTGSLVHPHFPRYALRISRAIEAIKAEPTLCINRARGERGVLSPGRFFDRALRTGKEYNAWEHQSWHRHPNIKPCGWMKSRSRRQTTPTSALEVDQAERALIVGAEIRTRWRRILKEGESML